MSETIDAIQEKLKPRNIVANATERVKSAATERVREMADTARETAQQAMDYTRDTATGVVGTAREPDPARVDRRRRGMVAHKRSRRGARPRDARDYGSYMLRLRPWTRDEEPTKTRATAASWAAFGRIRFRRRWPASGSPGWRSREATATTCRGTTAATAMTAGGTDRRAARERPTGDERSRRHSAEPERVRESHGVAHPEYASETAGSMRRMARRRQNQLQRMVQENPLLVGAGALMLGAAFGLAVPETEPRTS